MFFGRLRWFVPGAALGVVALGTAFLLRDASPWAVPPRGGMVGARFGDCSTDTSRSPRRSGARTSGRDRRRHRRSRRARGGGPAGHPARRRAARVRDLARRGTRLTTEKAFEPPRRTGVAPRTVSPADSKASMYAGRVAPSLRSRCRHLLQQHHAATGTKEFGQLGEHRRKVGAEVDEYCDGEDQIERTGSNGEVLTVERDESVAVAGLGLPDHLLFGVDADGRGTACVQPVRESAATAAEVERPQARHRRERGQQRAPLDLVDEGVFAPFSSAKSARRRAQELGASATTVRLRVGGAASEGKL